MRLTQAQRAQRRATRQNNKLQREYPLLASAGAIDDWYTTPEVELEYIKGHDIKWGMWWEKFRQREEMLQVDALALRERARRQLSPDVFSVKIRFRRQLPKEACYELDLWHNLGVK